jgi:hypothetical protein
VNILIEIFYNMTTVENADAVRLGVQGSFVPQHARSRAPSSVEFDVDYSHGAEFVARLGTSTTVPLIFRDQEGTVIPGPTYGGTVVNDSPATFEASLSADAQSIVIVPKALGSTILRYVYCRCLTANLIVRITNRVGPLRPHSSVRECVLDYLQVLEADYQPRTVGDIIGRVGAGRGLVESALKSLVQDGFVRQSGEFWLPLNPASAASSFDVSGNFR